MSCKECVERREAVVDAVLEGRLAAAAGHLVKGAAEMVGLKAKGVKPQPKRRIKTKD